MTCTLHVAWDEQLTEYDFGPGHPLAPVRVELTMELARALGVLTAAQVSVAAPSPATDADYAQPADEAARSQDNGGVDMEESAANGRMRTP